MSLVKRTVFSGLFLAIGLFLPFFTGQVPEIGSRLLPMHLPVLLCGFVCGWPYGLAVGAICPIFRSLLFTMPPMYPAAISMTGELAVYGLITGLLYARLPRRPLSVYGALLSAMVAGRLVWGVTRYALTFAGGSTFSMELFFAGALFDAIPGILLQLILVPLLVLAMEHMQKNQWNTV